MNEVKVTDEMVTAAMAEMPLFSRVWRVDMRAALTAALAVMDRPRQPINQDAAYDIVSQGN